MTAGGWLFLVVSLTFVWGLTAWCFYRVLEGSRRGSEHDEQPASKRRAS